MFESSAKMALESFNKLFNETVGEVYLLYISSIYYNYDKGDEIFNILSKNRINCIFYSLKLDEFYYNFNDNISNIKFDNSFMLIPSSDFYTEQIFYENINFKCEEGIYHKYDLSKKNKKKKMKKIVKINNLINEEENMGKKGTKDNLFFKKKYLEIIMI